MPQKTPTAQPPAGESPAADITALGPVLFHDLIAYVPWAPVAGAPGVGVANLAYVPDFLISSPQYFAGNATKRADNFPLIAQHAPMVIGQPTLLEGIGGLTAGQAVTRPLLGVESVNANDMTVGYGGM
jgi:hypothetical protein